MSDKILVHNNNYSTFAAESTKQSHQNGQVFNQRIILDLSTERSRQNALRINAAATRIFVEETTDLNTVCYMLPTSLNLGQDPYLLEKSLRIDFHGIDEFYFFWPAQPSRKMVIQLLTNNSIENGVVTSQESMKSCVGDIQFPIDGYHDVLSTTNKFTADGLGSFALNINNVAENFVNPLNTRAVFSGSNENFSQVACNIASVYQLFGDTYASYNFNAVELNANVFARIISMIVKAESMAPTVIAYDFKIMLRFFSETTFSDVDDFLAKSVGIPIVNQAFANEAEFDFKNILFEAPIRFKYAVISLEIFNTAGSIPKSQFVYSNAKIEVLTKLSRGL